MKKVLIYGLGVSGISTAKTLSKMGYDVYTFDKNKEEIDELKGYDYSPISVLNLTEYDYEFVVKSPGIKPSDDIVKKLSKKYEIISDIELSYRLFPEKKILAITGTNGKTSTTSMITHILNESGVKAVSVGNIGEGILWQMYNKDVVFVEELSSFQLKNTYKFHPHIASILNITPDHIDWHGDLNDYISSKLNITAKQTEDDYLILNKNDEILQKSKNSFRANIYEFSSTNPVEKGLYLDENIIYYKDEQQKIEVLNTDELKIIGNHNYENLMAAMLECYLFGLDFVSIAKAAKTFVSIEHRLELVDEIKGVKVYNDSKATNVDSAVKAINSFTNPIIIIAGGYDKKIDYSEYVKAFKENGKLMVIMGETKDQLKKLCEEEGINYILAEDMEQSVKIALENASKNNVILLSPASASWDMYKSYEIRGRDFKEKIEKYKGMIK
ncbi:UDP-N-acetylmuramoyl-L-alanine--D-glutamate ligase [Anaerococcus sp. ENR1011]|uniref:UDP-N-acetylmuramoylalanine--D-glutamate ligase n=1 Tax=Anaerococcus groningensis TaxID=3115616 RepID=A0ABW9MYR7_9FIRM